MTPTQLTVTTEEYEQGSSGRCSTCGATNYFLVELFSVSYKWQCAKCGEDNFHPLVVELKRRYN